MLRSGSPPGVEDDDEHEDEGEASAHMPTPSLRARE